MIYNFGILGCGRVAEHYRYILQEYSPLENLKIKACCDLDIEKAKKMAAAFEANYYNDLRQMLSDESLDAVLVLTPSGNHYENSRVILDSNCSVVVEKPITLIPEHAYELRDIARSKNLNYTGIFQNRYNLAMQAAKKAVTEGRLGKIVSASVRLRWCRHQDYYEDDWHGRWSSDGGVISQQAIHHIDAINWLCGPITKVSAIMDKRVNKLEAEDTMVAVFVCSNGALGTIEATTAARPDDYEASVSLVGEEGMIEIGGIALNEIVEWKFVNSVDSDELVKKESSEIVPNGYGVSHARILSDYINKIEHDKELPIDSDEAVKAVELVHALYASAEQNIWVELDSNPRSSLLGKRLGKNNEDRE